MQVLMEGGEPLPNAAILSPNTPQLFVCLFVCLFILFFLLLYCWWAIAKCRHSLAKHTAAAASDICSISHFRLPPIFAHLHISECLTKLSNQYFVHFRLLPIFCQLYVISFSPIFTYCSSDCLRYLLLIAHFHISDCCRNLLNQHFSFQIASNISLILYFTLPPIFVNFPFQIAAKIYSMLHFQILDSYQYFLNFTFQVLAQWQISHFSSISHCHILDSLWYVLNSTFQGANFPFQLVPDNCSISHFHIFFVPLTFIQINI